MLQGKIFAADQLMGVVLDHHAQRDRTVLFEAALAAIHGECILPRQDRNLCLSCGHEACDAPHARSATDGGFAVWQGRTHNRGALLSQIIACEVVTAGDDNQVRFTVHLPLPVRRMAAQHDGTGGDGREGNKLAAIHGQATGSSLSALRTKNNEGENPPS